MGRGILAPLIPLGITVECYYVLNNTNDSEYLIYFPKKYIAKVKKHVTDPFESDPARRYPPHDHAHRNFLTLSSQFGIKSSDYAGFYAYAGYFDRCIKPLIPPVLQGDSL